MKCFDWSASFLIISFQFLEKSERKTALLWFRTRTNFLMLEFSWEWDVRAQASSNHSFPTRCLCNWYCSGSSRNCMAIWCRITLVLLCRFLFHDNLCIFKALTSRSFPFSLPCVSTVCNIHMLWASPVMYVVSLCFNSDTLNILVGRDGWLTK